MSEPGNAMVPEAPQAAEATLPIAIPEPTEPGELQILARYPYQMEAAQKRLIDWALAKVREAQAEVQDLAENYEIAVRNRWGASAIKRALDRAGRREAFYTKIKLALEAGYSIVPDFPVDLFAIRTRKKIPSPNAGRNAWNVENQTSETLAAGAGNFVSDETRNYIRETGRVDSEGKLILECYANDFELIEFPFTTAKPVVLKAVERAMADKFFDEIGALPGRRKKGDPIIVGRIKNPIPYAPCLTFLIYWFIDLREMP